MFPGIFAIGDVIGPPWLAHVASAEGIHCVEVLKEFIIHQLIMITFPDAHIVNLRLQVLE